MATVDLTIEQILGAVEQLSPTERRRLQREMTRLESSPKRERPIKRMPRRRTKRMSELLLKASSARLSPGEDAELNALVEDFESLTLANAEMLARADERPSRAAANRGRTTKRS